ncbi:ABC transporter substrate-binding protein [Humibacter albus]|jgi:sorbitol/mannitol transport system substrate-binding protein|uniref:ABC transporter substrate-binding protein n=1 Tax=Humibacter albus TaxID=427754 RepID=UPI0003B6E8D4|nr:sugar ABC transporter substrate-binding protein [Humibacter albus]
MKRKHLRAVAGLAVATATLVALAGCSGAGGSGGSGGSADGSGSTIRVLMVNNPQMVDLQKLTNDNFTKKTGIKVKYTVLPEDSLRAKASQEFSAQAGQYDVATISNYEVPFYSTNGWLLSLSDNVAKDSKFDQSDILKPIQDALTGSDGKVYAEPFYGESSMLYYRKDVFAKQGLTMPANPTWAQVADLAKKLNDVEPGMAGICLRGQPGWGQNIAPLTTVVNTMGGTWFDKNWNAEVDKDGFATAANFYVNLVKNYGEKGAAQAGYTECLNDLTQGKAAMWYDATAAAGSLEASDSPVAGKIGYAAAPVDKTKNSGWLYSWAWGIEKASKNATAAEKFIEWASGPDYAKQAAKAYGWAQVPPGTRTSLYENADYQKSAAAFYKQVENAIKSADPENPGVQKRPAPGIQFVAIPEFANLGTDASQQISDAIAGKTTVDAALKSIQTEAQKVGDTYKKKQK